MLSRSIMISKLISDIEDAFFKVEYPGDYNIALMDEMEGEEVNKFFKGKSWQDVHFKEVSELSFSLIYFKPKAFIYFLPAFLIGSIKDSEAQFGPSYNTILMCFIPPKNENKDFKARMKLFNKKQFHIIRRFLYYLIAIEDSDEVKIKNALNYVEGRIEEF